MESEIELEPRYNDVRGQREFSLSKRLAAACEGNSYRSIGQKTGYHPESIRRYFNGVGKIPAEFIGQLVSEYDLNAHFILSGEFHAPDDSDLLLVATDRLINELGRRILMIENSAVGSVIVHDAQSSSRE